MATGSGFGISSSFRLSVSSLLRVSVKDSTVASSSDGFSPALFSSLESLSISTFFSSEGCSTSSISAVAGVEGSFFGVMVSASLTVEMDFLSATISST